MQKNILTKTYHKNRRAFLRYLFSAVTVVLSGFILWILKNFLFFRTDSHGVTVGTYSQFKEGKIAHKKGDRFFLVHDAHGLYVLSDVCTHLGCLLKHDKNQLTCHCHGGVFSLDGQPLDGPAKKPLDHYFISRNKEGLLVVDPTRVVHEDFRYKE